MRRHSDKPLRMRWERMSECTQRTCPESRTAADKEGQYSCRTSLLGVLYKGEDAATGLLGKVSRHVAVLQMALQAPYLPQSQTMWAESLTEAPSAALAAATAAAFQQA